jgi:hypothetical protein
VVWYGRRPRGVHLGVGAVICSDCGSAVTTAVRMAVDYTGDGATVKSVGIHCCQCAPGYALQQMAREDFRLMVAKRVVHPPGQRHAGPDSTLLLMQLLRLTE